MTPPLRISPAGAIRTVIALVIILAASTAARAQSDPVFSQAWALPTLYNPAFTGDTDFIRIRGAARLQWIGIDNAPKSFVAAADTPFKLFGKRMGAGLTFTQETLGLFSNLLVTAQGSYRFKALKGSFAAGIQLGYFNSRFRGSGIYIPDGDDYHDPDDPALPKQDLSGNAFDISLGLAYSNQKFHLALSALHLTSPTVSMSVEGSETTESHTYETQLKSTFYFDAGGNIGIRNSLFQVHPSLLLATDLDNFSAVASLRASYNHFLSFGVGYRWKDAVFVMVGAEFKNFFLGYAYDYPLSAISKASSGSHELVAGYRLKLDLSGKNKNKHRSIRLM